MIGHLMNGHHVHIDGGSGRVVVVVGWLWWCWGCGVVAVVGVCNGEGHGGGDVGADHLTTLRRKRNETIPNPYVDIPN